MSRFAGYLARTVAAGALLSAAACADLLDVSNPNNPETDRVLSSPADVEALIRDAFIQAKEPLLASDGINMQLGVVAFENSSTAANFGQNERSQFPRAPIINATSDQFHPEYYEVWAESYAAIRSASDGLAKLSETGFTLGSAASDARARAFAKFVLFFAHANLAITYDKAAIYDETVPASEVRTLEPYGTVMTAALGYADQAITLATGTPGVSFPSDWLGEDMNAARFAQIVHSLKARYATQVARNPAERNAVNWAAVIADVDAGITTDWEVADDDNRFDYWMHDYMSFRGAWHQVPYFLHGMADTSGAYQAWMADADIMTRDPIVIQTPDLRFPQGQTFAAQQAAPGLYIRAKTNTTGEAGWLRPERGTWRWSNYIDKRYQDYYDATNAGVALPIIQVKEIQLIKAEGLHRTGNTTAALAIVNSTRTTDGGLPAATAAGAPGGNACVPKLPSGACGDFIETLKWEKRMVLFMTVYGGFYFDSRGWGDLPAGTYLHYPVPARELEVRQLPLYTFGGASDATAAPVGTYGY